MPKVKYGTLITCDSCIKKYIEKINIENNNQIIQVDLNEKQCVVDTNQLKFLKEKIKELQNKCSFEPFTLSNPYSITVNK